jgi:hypothetical protein
VLIQVMAANGPYTGSVTITRGLTGGGTLQINGSGGQATLSTTGNAVSVSGEASVLLTNLLITSAAGKAISVQGGGTLVQTGGGITFGTAASDQISASAGGSFVALNNYTIAGGAAQHIHATAGGQVSLTGHTITLTGTPPFGGAFVAVGTGGVVTAVGTSFSGPATGVRYNITSGGIVSTSAANAAASDAFFPGTWAGILYGGGAFDALGVRTSMLRITAPIVPVSAGATGAQGDIAYDADYLYVCVSANTWRRTALSSW